MHICCGTLTLPSEDLLPTTGRAHAVTHLPPSLALQRSDIACTSLAPCCTNLAKLVAAAICTTATTPSSSPTLLAPCAPSATPTPTPTTSSTPALYLHPGHYYPPQWYPIHQISVFPPPSPALPFQASIMPTRPPHDTSGTEPTPQCSLLRPHLTAPGPPPLAPSRQFHRPSMAHAPHRSSTPTTLSGSTAPSRQFHNSSIWRTHLTIGDLCQRGLEHAPHHAATHGRERGPAAQAWRGSWSPCLRSACVQLALHLGLRRGRRPCAHMCMCVCALFVWNVCVGACACACVRSLSGNVRLRTCACACALFLWKCVSERTCVVAPPCSIHTHTHVYYTHQLHQTHPKVIAHPQFPTLAHVHILGAYSGWSICAL